jgi:hypothetical protein|tara:strand:- start:217 stop:561 length:345 start_codon:yes stop_codon:yes gene_type:complete
MSKVTIEKQNFVYLNSQKYPDVTCIGINTGKFKGVVYKYGNVTLGEPSEKNGLPFKFSYDILDTNGLKKSQFDEEFFTLIGDILVEIIDEQAGKNDGTIEQHNRENDPIESDNE